MFSFKINFRKIWVANMNVSFVTFAQMCPLLSDSTYKQRCTACVQLVASEDGTVVKEVVNEHNHEVNEVRAEHLTTNSASVMHYHQFMLQWNCTLNSYVHSSF